MFRILVLTAALALAPAAPVAAQSPDCPAFAPGCDRLPGLLDGLGPLFDDLGRDLAPLMDDLARDLGPLMDRLGRRLDPFLTQLQGLLGDLSGWEAPEVLPNGDILIRRRPGPRDPDRDPDQAEPPVTAPFEL